MEEVALGLFGDEGEFREFEKIEDPSTDTAGVIDIFQEEGVLAYPGCVEGLAVAANRNDELIVGDGEGWDFFWSGAAGLSLAAELEG